MREFGAFVPWLLMQAIQRLCSQNFEFLDLYGAPDLILLLLLFFVWFGLRSFLGK